MGVNTYPRPHLGHVLGQFPHYNDIIMGSMASQITSLTIVYSVGYSGADQRKNQSSASLAFVRGIHRGPVNSPHKWPVTRKMFPFDDVMVQHVTCCDCKRQERLLSLGVFLLWWSMAVVLTYKIVSRTLCSGGTSMFYLPTLIIKL